MIIFGSMLNTFNGALFLSWGLSWSSIENWLKPKTEPPSGNLDCPNP